MRVVRRNVDVVRRAVLQLAVHIAAVYRRVLNLSTLRIAQKLREGKILIMPRAAASLENLPHQDETHEDENPENDRLDR